MALAVRERILAALFARLGERLALRGDGGADVPLRRNPGTGQAATTAVDQYDGAHDVEVASDTGHTLFVMTVDLELFAPDGPALNELYARVRDAIDRDITFDSLAEKATERSFSAPAAGTVKGHPDVVGAFVVVDIEYRTRDDDVRYLN